jgi:hypothetical protein
LVAPGTKKARDLVVAGLSFRETSRVVGQGPPRARATTVAGRPVTRDPSRLLLVTRFIRESIVALGDIRAG